MEYLPAIISAIGTIIAAWFAYNQAHGLKN